MKETSRKAREKWSFRRKAIAWSIVLLALSAGYFFTSPYITGWAIARSIENRDEERLAELIDFTELRKDVKNYLSAQIIKKIRAELNEKPGLFSMLSASARQEAELIAMRAVINRELTPAAVIHRSRQHQDQALGIDFRNWKIDNVSYTGVSTLHFEILNVRFFAEWDFVDWRICGCEALPHFELPTGFSFSKESGGQ